MLWDTHMHTAFSGDSTAPPKEMIDRAAALGLGGLCFTDHLDLDYPKEPALFLLDIERYLPALRSLQEEYKETFPVLVGNELGLQPHLAETHRALLSRHAFDFVIGSSHVVHGMDPYYPEYYDGRSQQAAYEEYFISILENIRAFDGFDVYGHLDYVVRYGPQKNEGYSYTAFADIIDEILKLLISKGKGIEVNTGGFKCGLGHPNPTEDILKRYRQLGGEILTLGADAHIPAHVGYDFEKLPPILKECGFSHYTVFQNRKPVFYPLP